MNIELYKSNFGKESLTIYCPTLLDSLRSDINQDFHSTTAYLDLRAVPFHYYPVFHFLAFNPAFNPAFNSNFLVEFLKLMNQGVVNDIVQRIKNLDNLTKESQKLGMYR